MKLYITQIFYRKTKEYTECGNVTPEWNCDYSVKKKMRCYLLNEKKSIW
ncbi:MAG: hypothetical protein ACLTS6_15390 [Anaerobutyricum sp.]